MSVVYNIQLEGYNPIVYANLYSIANQTCATQLPMGNWYIGYIVFHLYIFLEGKLDRIMVSTIIVVSYHVIASQELS